MMDEKIYWIWLQQALKYGNHKAKDILKFYNSIEEFYKSGEYDWRLCGFFSNSEINSMNSTSLEIAKDIYFKCQNLGYEILTLSDKNYSELLFRITNPPIVLYAKGDTSILNNDLTISVVGTRSATRYGIEMAHEISYKVAKSNGVVVSGGALGIDAASHRGALDAGGKTIAVLGCGINYNYLLENESLRNKISNSGLLISEYPPNYPSYNYNFPMRNRIISGLSLATIVVEAGRKSGSLITANLANEQNRDVFVVPVDSQSPLSTGSQSLIRDGALAISNVDDIINQYKMKSENRIPKQKINFLRTNYSSESNMKNISNSKNEQETKSFTNISKSSKLVYDVICKGRINVDNIKKSLCIEIKELLSALTELEIYGLIKACPGQYYEKSNN